MYSSDSLLFKMGFNGILCKKRDCQLHVCSTSGMAALWNSILNVGILNFYIQEKMFWVSLVLRNKCRLYLAIDKRNVMLECLK